jgi:hypothetical protein
MVSRCECWWLARVAPRPGHVEQLGVGVVVLRVSTTCTGNYVTLPVEGEALGRQRSRQSAAGTT